MSEREVTYCPVTDNKVSCEACSMYDKRCLVRAALRSMPKMADELSKLIDFFTTEDYIDDDTTGNS